MAQLVLSVTRRHCNQLDTIEGGRRVGGSSSELSLRPHALYQYNCKYFFCLQTTHLSLGIFQNLFNQQCRKRLFIATLLG